jgi:hypothetical protein
MTGGYLHEGTLDALEEALEKQNAEVSRQVQSRVGAKTGFVDLVARLGSERFVIEVEMSPRRVANDLLKAAALEATWLWIVVPNHRVAGSVRAELRKLGVREMQPWIRVLAFGQAIQGIVGCFSRFPGVIACAELGSDTPVRSGRRCPS